MKHKTIRILHVIGVMDRGGAETMIMNLYRNIDRNKVQFDFVENRSTEGAYDDEIRRLGGMIYRCPHYNGKNHFEYVKWWKRFWKEHAKEYRAVHGHLGSTAAIYLRIAKHYGVYTIAHSHNTSGTNVRDIIYGVYSYPTRYIADYFFSCSLAAGISRYGKKICRRSNQFRVLNNAIDTGHFSYNEDLRNEVRESLGVQNKLVFGHVGRFFEQKNHQFLIKIFKDIHKKNPDSALILVGDGPLRAQIESTVEEYGLSADVKFIGVKEDVNPYYQAMDVFVFPSLFEGLGIVAVEAQCAGVPCLISDTVQKECIVTKGLIQQKSLTSTSKEWALAAIDMSNLNRKDHSQEVINNGYDIHGTAKWLEKFYLNIEKVL